MCDRGSSPRAASHLGHWVQAAREVKPGVVMPNFLTLPEEVVRAVAVCLGAAKVPFTPRPYLKKVCSQGLAGASLRR